MQFFKLKFRPLSLIVLAVGAAAVPTSFALNKAGYTWELQKLEVFNAQNPYGRDLLKGYRELLAKEGSSGARGGGDAKKLQILFERMEDLRIDQKSFGRDLGNVDPARLKDLPDLLSKYTRLIEADPDKISQEANYRLLDQCLDSLGNPIEMVYSETEGAICITSSIMFAEDSPERVLNQTIAFRSGVDISPEEWTTLFTRTYGARDLRSLYQEWRSRYNLGRSLAPVPTSAARCRIAFDADASPEFSWTKVREISQSVEVRSDRSGGFAVHGRSNDGEEFYGRCAE
jgi:hypothetical protein